jgi:hypothetical protein
MELSILEDILRLAVFRVDQRLSLCVAVHGNAPSAVDGDCGAGALSFAGDGKGRSSSCTGVPGTVGGSS